MPSIAARQFWGKNSRPQRRGKVLIVDNSPCDLQCYRAALQAEGFTVCAITDRTEALEHLRNEAFDFILVDQGSPAFEGRAILERVVEMDRHLPVVVVTHCLNMGCYLEAMQLGAVDYVEKPLSPVETVRLIEGHLRRRQVTA